MTCCRSGGAVSPDAAVAAQLLHPAACGRGDGLPAAAALDEPPRYGVAPGHRPLRVRAKPPRLRSVISLPLIRSAISPPNAHSMVYSSHCLRRNHHGASLP